MIPARVYECTPSGLEGAVGSVLAAPSTVATLRAFARLGLRVINHYGVGGLDCRNSHGVGRVSEGDGRGLSELRGEHFECLKFWGGGKQIIMRGEARGRRDRNK